MSIKIKYMVDEAGKPIQESFQISGFHREITDAEKNAVFAGIFPPTMRIRRSMRIQCEIFEDVEDVAG